MMREPNGYIVGCGSMGYVEAYHKYILFASESDYREFIADM